MAEPMTFADAAYKLLTESGEPRHYRWLAEEAMRRDWISTSGKTPEATMYALIHTEIKNEIPGKRPSRFVKIGRGMFGLAEWLRGRGSCLRPVLRRGRGPGSFAQIDGRCVVGQLDDLGSPGFAGSTNGGLALRLPSSRRSPSGSTKRMPWLELSCTCRSQYLLSRLAQR
jgi:hypothetical protein